LEKLGPLCERLFPRFRPKRELRPQGSGTGWGARITWLGTAGFIIESRETTLLVDPYLSRPGLGRLLAPYVLTRAKLVGSAWTCAWGRAEGLSEDQLEGERADVLLAGLAGRQGTWNYVGRLLSALDPKLVVPTHHDAFFAPLERGLHLLPGIDVEGFVSDVFTRLTHASVITPDYEEPICVPPGDARGSVLSAS
jgi:hypothetical protein